MPFVIASEAKQSQMSGETIFNSPTATIYFLVNPILGQKAIFQKLLDSSKINSIKYDRKPDLKA
jgi:hypothetical protein